MADDTNPYPYQKSASDGSLRRKQRERILTVLENHPDGIGFNELLSEVDDIISRNTLKKRLNKYEEEDLIESPDDWRRGQKKKYSLTKSGSKPDGLEEEYKNGQDYICRIWKEALDMYGEEDFSRDKVQNHILNERIRFCLRESESAISMEEEYSPEVEIEAKNLPRTQEDLPITDFYKIMSGELHKFYTEVIFGRIYIETEGKASRIKKDVVLETYNQTQKLMGRFYKIWKKSDVPLPESDSTSN